MIRRGPVRLFIFCLLVAFVLPAVGASAARVAASPTSVSWNAATKTVNLTVVAAYNSVAGGFNFNGYNNGGLTITVPKGAKVVVAFTNKAPLPHSVVITPYASRTLGSNFPLAFKGSSTPSPNDGKSNVSTPQVFSFIAAKVGLYALVCGVPGHAVGGMWITFAVGDVSAPTVRATGAATGSGDTGSHMDMSSCGKGDSTGGAIAGVVTDATTGKPLAHSSVVVGWTTLKRVGETDAMGHYCVSHLTPAYAGAFGFAEGYIYYHGHPVSIKAGKTVSYSFKMPRQTSPADQLPTLSGAMSAAASVKVGGPATFSVHVNPGKGGPMSPEVFAVNSALGTSVLLEHKGGDLYSGTLRVPAGTKPAAYTFAFFGAKENCLENAPYQKVSLTVTG